MNVGDARSILMDSVLHTGTDTWSTTKQDRAIIVACRRFLRESHCQRTLATFDTVAAQREYVLDSALDSSLANFISGALTGKPFIAATDFRPVNVMSFEYVRGQADYSNASGRPELIGFVGNTAWLYPSPDDAYIIRLPMYDDLDMSGWTIGGVDGTTLAHEINIPERYAWDVVWWGCRASLLYGAPGHPDAGASMAEFQSVIARAKNEAQNAGFAFPRSRNYFNQSYGPNRGL